MKKYTLKFNKKLKTKIKNKKTKKNKIYSLKKKIKGGSHSSVKTNLSICALLNKIKSSNSSSSSNSSLNTKINPIYFIFKDGEEKIINIGEITIDENETESLNSNINVFFDNYIKILDNEFKFNNYEILYENNKCNKIEFGKEYDITFINLIPTFKPKLKVENTTLSSNIFNLENLKKNQIVKFLKWNNNSCYIDSIIYCLFILQSSLSEKLLSKLKDNNNLLFIKNLLNTKTIFKIKDNDDYITRIKTYCITNNLQIPKITLGLCDQFTLTNSGSSVYFLIILLHMFCIGENCNTIIGENIINFSNGFELGTINNEYVLSKTNTIKQILDNNSTKEFIIIQELTTIKYDTLIKTYNDFNLGSIINRAGKAHYTAIIGNGNDYYEVDDMTDNLKLIKDDKKINGEIYFYYKKSTSPLTIYTNDEYKKFI